MNDDVAEQANANMKVILVDGKSHLCQLQRKTLFLVKILRNMAGLSEFKREKLDVSFGTDTMVTDLSDHVPDSDD